MVEEFKLKITGDTKDLEKQLKGAAGNVAKMIKQINTATDQFEVFKEVAGYIRQIDQEMAVFKTKNKDLFEQVFGIGGGSVDKAIHDALAPLLSLPDTLSKVLGTVSGKAIGIATGQIKDVDGAINEIAISMQTIQKILDPKSGINLDFLSGTDDAATKAKKLLPILQNLNVNWKELIATANSGFGNAGAAEMEKVAGAATDAVASIDSVKQKLKELKAVAKSKGGELFTLDDVLGEMSDPKNSKEVSSYLQNLITQINTNKKAIKGIGNKDVITADDYQNLLKYIEATSKLYALKSAGKKITLSNKNREAIFGGADSFVAKNMLTSGALSQLTGLKITGAMDEDILGSIEKIINKRSGGGKTKKSADSSGGMEATASYAKKAKKQIDELSDVYKMLYTQVDKYLEAQKQLAALPEDSPDTPKYEEAMDNASAKIVEQFKLTGAQEDQLEDILVDGVDAKKVIAKLVKKLGLSLPMTTVPSGDLQAISDKDNNATTNQPEQQAIKDVTNTTAAAAEKKADEEERARLAAEAAAEATRLKAEAEERARDAAEAAAAEDKKAYEEKAIIDLNQVEETISKVDVLKNSINEIISNANKHKLEFSVVLNGEDVSVRKGRNASSTNVVESVGNMMSSLGKYFIDGHSHTTTSKTTNDADLRSFARLKKYGVTNHNAIMGPDGATVYDFSQVSNSDMEKAIEMVETLRKSGVATRDEIENIFKSLNSEYDVVRRFDASQMGDFAQYISEVTKNAQNSIDPLKQFKGIVDYLSDGKIDWSKYTDLLSGFKPENAKNIFDQIVRTETDGKADVYNFDKKGMSDILSELSGVDSAGKQLTNTLNETGQAAERARTAVEGFGNAGTSIDELKAKAAENAGTAIKDANNKANDTSGLESQIQSYQQLIDLLTEYQNLEKQKRKIDTSPYEFYHSTQFTADKYFEGGKDAAMKDFQDIWSKKNKLNQERIKSPEYLDPVMNECAKQEIAAYEEELKKLAAAYVDLGGSVDDFKSKEKRAFAQENVDLFNSQKEQFKAVEAETDKYNEQFEKRQAQIARMLKADGTDIGNTSELIKNVETFGDVEESAKKMAQTLGVEVPQATGTAGAAVEDLKAKAEAAKTKFFELTKSLDSDLFAGRYDEFSLGKSQAELDKAQQELKELADAGHIAADVMEEVDAAYKKTSSAISASYEGIRNENMYKEESGSYDQGYLDAEKRFENDRNDYIKEANELRHQVETLEQQLAQVQVQSTSKTSVDDSAAIKMYEALKQKLIEVTAEINAKTEAFINEKQAVDANVGVEIEKLEELRKKLADISALVTTIGQINVVADTSSPIGNNGQQKQAKAPSDSDLQLQKYKDKALLNVTKKSADEIYNALKVDPNNIAPELDAIREQYLKIIEVIETYKKKRKVLTSEELEGLKKLESQLKENAVQYAKNNVTQTKPKKNTYGTTQLLNTTAKYNTLSGIANSDEFSGSSIVQGVLQNYTEAFEKLIAKQKEFKIGEDLTTEEAKEKIVAFKQLQMECNGYASELNKIITSSQKLTNGVSEENLYRIAPDLDLSASESRAEALTDAVNELSNGQAKVVGFNKDFTALRYTVKNTDGTFTEMTATLNAARTAIVNTTGETKKSTTAFGRFFNELKGKAKGIATYLISMTGFQEIWQQIRQGITYVREIDSALTELKKVTDETEASYQRFLQTAAKTAGVLGTTVADFTNATADFARLGYSINEASKLAEAASVYKNVGDGITDISQASESIISTMKAFGIEAESSMEIVDKFNEIGNNFAISSVGIGDALQLSASALFEAGNDINQSIGLITAANSVVQDPDKVGTALKTLSLRLRGAKADLEDAGLETDNMCDSVSTLREKLIALTGGKVDIMLDDTTFKSTADIIGEMSRAWDSMTDINRSAALELMGGKRQANILASMIKNYDIAEDVIEQAADASGSALAENEKYLDSIQGKINQFTNSLQTMWMNFIDADAVKFIVTLGTELIQLIDKLGVLKTVLLGFVAGKLIKGIFSGVKFASVAKEISTLTMGLKMFKKGTISATMASAEQVATNGLLTTSFKVLALDIWGAVKAIAAFLFTNPVGWAILATTAIVGVISHINKLKQETKEAAEEAINAYKEAQNTIKNNARTIKSISDDYQRLAKGVNSFGQNISLTSDEYARYNEITNQIADMFPQMVSGYTAEGNAIIKMKGNVEELTKAYKEQAQAARDKVILSGDDVFSAAEDEVEGLKEKAKAYEVAMEMAKGMTTEAALDKYGTTLRDQASEILNDLGFESYIGQYASGKTYKSYGLRREFNNGTQEYEDAYTNDEYLVWAEKRNQLEIAYNDVLAQQEAALSKVNTVLQAHLDSDITYAGLTTEAQSAISSIVSELDPADFDYDDDAMVAFIKNNILIPISENKNGVQDALSNLLTIDESSTSYEAYQALEQALLDAIKDLPEEVQAAIKVAFKINDTTDYDTYANHTKEILEDEYDDKVSELSIEDLKIAGELEVEDGTLLSWEELIAKIAEAKQIAETASTGFEEISKSIDSISGAYSTLSDAINEYNTNGFLTLDTLQAILSLEPEYLALLQFENGQMTLNKELMMQMVQAKLNEAEATAVSSAISQIDALVKNEQAEATTNSGNAANNAVSGINAYGAACSNMAIDAINGANAVTQLNNALNGAISRGVSQEQINGVLNNLNTSIAAIRSTRESLSSNFSTVMGSSPSGGGGSRSSSDSEFDWIDVYFENLSTRIKKAKAKLENVIDDTSKINLKDDFYDQIQKVYAQKQAGLVETIDYLSNQAAKALAKVPAKYRKAAKNGSIAISTLNSDTADAVKDYRNYVDKLSDYQVQLAQNAQEIAELAKEQFEDNASDYDNKISVKYDVRIEGIEDAINIAEERGETVSSAYYKSLIANEEKNRKELVEKRNQMQADLDEAVRTGKVKKYSDVWYDMVQNIFDADSAIRESTKSIVQWKNELNEVNFAVFDGLIEKVKDLNDEIDNVYDLLSDEDKVVDDMGNWTKEGVAALGLMVQKYENARYASEQLADEIKNLDPKDFQSTEAYEEKLKDLTECQWEEIDAMESAKDEIVSLNETRIDAVKDGIQKEIDAYEELIEKKKENLSAEKEAYEFQKDVKEKEKDITKLEKQIAALSGSTAASDIAKRKQLQSELLTAKSELEDTYYSHSIDAQQEALDKDLENYKSEQDKKIEELEAFLKDVEGLVEDSIVQVLTNADIVLNQLNATAVEYKLTLSDELTTPWVKAAEQAKEFKQMAGSSLNALMSEDGVLQTFSAKAKDLLKSPWNSAKDAANSFKKIVVQNLNNVKSELQKLALDAKQAAKDAIKELDSVVDKTKSAKKEVKASTNTSSGAANNPGSNGKGNSGGSSGGYSGGSQSNANVKALQQYLNSYFKGNLSIDGKYGPATTSAVKAMQKTVGTNADGKYGSGTAKAVKKYWLNLAETTRKNNNGSSMIGQAVREYKRRAQTVPVAVYAKGTTGVKKDQIANIDELGEELILNVKNGRLQYLTKGTGVVPADLTETLMEWGKLDPRSVLERSRPAIGAPHIINNNFEVNLSFGELVHVDAATKDSIPELQKMVRNEFDTMMKQVNSSLRRYTR